MKNKKTTKEKMEGAISDERSGEVSHGQMFVLRQEGQEKPKGNFSCFT